jgi:hypothetical protein
MSIVFVAFHLLWPVWQNALIQWQSCSTWIYHRLEMLNFMNLIESKSEAQIIDEREVILQILSWGSFWVRTLHRGEHSNTVKVVRNRHLNMAWNRSEIDGSIRSWWRSWIANSSPDSTKRRNWHTSSVEKIKDYCANQFQAPITRGWVNSFVPHCPDQIIQTKSIPEEEQLLQVPRVFLDRTVQDLNG